MTEYIVHNGSVVLTQQELDVLQAMLNIQFLLSPLLRYKQESMRER